MKQTQTEFTINQLKEAKSLIKELIPMAEDAICLYVEKGNPVEEIERERKILEEAKSIVGI